MLNTERKTRDKALTEFIGWRTSPTIKSRIKAVAEAKGLTPSTLLTLIVVNALDAIQREMLAV